MRRRTTAWLWLYLTALTAAALLAVFAAVPGVFVTPETVLVWALAGAVVAAAATGGLTRSAPAAVPGIGGIGPAVPLAFALALTAGTDMAVAALGFGLLVGALRSGSLARAVIDVAIPVLSVSAAGALMAVIATRSDLLAVPTVTVVEFSAIAVGGAVIFVVQVSLTAVAVALLQRIAVVPLVRQELAAHAATGMVLLSLAPVVIVVATAAATMLPLLTLPVVAIYRSSRAVQASEHLALHDVLTGLPNRRLFLERLAVAMAEAQSTAGQVAVLLIDLDRFKEVNDQLGHHAGDLLLQAIGPALSEQVTEAVTVARMGGDEFAMCVPDVDGVDEAVRVAKRVIARLALPLAIDGFTIDIGASIGIALSPGDANDVSTVLQHADIAMYVAKETRGGYEVYSPERDPNRRQRITSPGDLRRATELGQLVVHYQPKADVVTGRARGVEALVRWNHPTLGLVAPAEFIPLAERAGLMGPLTAFVMARALEQCARWRDQGVPLRLAVNVSVQSLYDDTFPAVVAGLLNRSELDASQLVLDVTESTVMADPRRAQRVLAELGALGVTLAIDDFGTGYSSLAYLKQLPVSELKIDRSFVVGMATDSDDAVIVHSTIDLGQKFGLEVVAEGVESRRVWQLLERLGCDLAQGSYVCPPLPADQLTPWLYDNAQRTREPLDAIGSSTAPRA
jgi:diguanylate cyclase (GGDEF)-like protein